MPDIKDLAALIEPIIGDPARAQLGVFFHLLIAGFVCVIIAFSIMTIMSTSRTPSSPVGAIGRDYDALISTRQPLSNYLTASGTAGTVPMVQFQVATANFGGIFTEKRSLTNPWTGTVSPDAARLQVEAGARAIVFDIWPDPKAPANPVVGAMLDTTQWTLANWWRNTGGLNKGVGRYSNWQLLTRNTVSAGTMMTAACSAAFDPAKPQNMDPFFLILKLHGAMNVDYLNKLGAQLATAMSTHAMDSGYGKWTQQGTLCKTPLSEFAGKVYVIVIPEITLGYNILPGVNTYSGFLNALLPTTLGQYTNAVEQNPNSMLFEPGSIGPIPVASQPACAGQPPSQQQTLAQAGFCLVQPSTGGQLTDNPTLFKDNGLQICQQTGAQFVAVNLFSPDPSDGVLTAWFDPKNFGTWSFKKGA